MDGIELQHVLKYNMLNYIVREREVIAISHVGDCNITI